MKSITSEVDIQRQYYAKTAQQYDGMHVCEGDEHFFALSFLIGMLDYLNVKSILDIGSGTGRAIAHIKSVRPDIQIVGIEPVEELRHVGYKKGLHPTELIAGDATKLQFQDGEFDLVCEFGVLHHIPKPEIAVSEMLRVARKAIIISDNNNFGAGSWPVRKFKQTLNAVGLWTLFDWMKTGGKMYKITEGDGLAYSYSAFNNYHQIQRTCKSVHVLNTKNSGMSSYESATHVAILGIKLDFQVS
jgi:ubiquinone/menaquinone biosynthesis C-methylase UbiE